MRYKIIHLPNYLLLIDNRSEITVGDFFMANQGVHQCIEIDDSSSFPYITLNKKGEKIGHFKTWKTKIIAYSPINGGEKIGDLPLLPPLVIEMKVEELSIDYLDHLVEIDKKEKDFTGMSIGAPLRNNRERLAQAQGFEDGYFKALETFKYSDQDVLKIISIAKNEGFTRSSERILEVFKENLTSYRIPTGFDCEIEYLSNAGEWKSVLVPSEWESDTQKRIKEVVHPSGNKIICGKYIF
jgi:hypothetical protein